MRIWFHLFLVLVSCGVYCSQKASATPETALQAKAQALLDRYYGHGHAQAFVTLKQGQGQRTVRDHQFDDKGFVTRSKVKRETYQEKYLNESRTEEIDLPQRWIVTHQDHWLEGTFVSVVVDRDPGADVTDLLWVGLGLNSKNGDQLRVVRAAL